MEEMGCRSSEWFLKNWSHWARVLKLQWSVAFSMKHLVHLFSKLDEQIKLFDCKRRLRNLKLRKRSSNMAHGA